MTLQPVPARTPRVWLTLAVAAVVAFAAWRARQFDEAPLGVLGGVALAAWVAWTVIPARRARLALLALLALLVAGAAAGAVAAGGGATLFIAPTVAALILVVGDLRLPPAAGAGFAGGIVVLLAVTAGVTHLPVTALLWLLGVLAFGALLGVTRRARAVADERERGLLLASIESEREAARTRLLEDRAAVARDIHDMLAHSLGGLVLQLDAIDALLERGRTAEAAGRVGAARALAADGMSEARRAVAALRAPDGSGPPAPEDSLETLVATHRGLGAEIEVDGDLSLAGIDLAHREALVRALQESLANARRHAPGSPARVSAARTPDGFDLTVRTTRRGDPPTSPGGGHGLTGMAERFLALGDGSSASAGQDGADFVVSARAVTA